MTPELDVTGISTPKTPMLLEIDNGVFWNCDATNKGNFCGERTNLCLIGVKLYEIPFALFRKPPQKVLSIGHKLISILLYFGQRDICTARVSDIAGTIIRIATNVTNLQQIVDMQNKKRRR